MRKQQMASYYGSSYAHGMSGEKIVTDHLKAIGVAVEASTKYENIMQDIDCWITVNNEFESIGVTPGCYPLSIKRQDAGLKYGNFGFELAQQITASKEWENVGWFNTGAAPIYAILQGTTIYYMTKLEILRLYNEKGWVRERKLGYQVKARVSATARYCDAICGYLNVSDVKALTYSI